MRTNSGCDSAGPSVGRWQGSTAAECSAPRFPQQGIRPWGLAGTADEQELAWDIMQFRFQQQSQMLGKMATGTVTQHLLHTPFCTLSFYTKSWKATFLTVGCLCWLVWSTNPLHIPCDERRLGQRQMMVNRVLGLSGFVYSQTFLCHPLDNLAAIPKDLRVTCVVPSFGNLSYSFASSTCCICSKCLLMKLFSHPLWNEGCPLGRLWCRALYKGLSAGSPHRTGKESLQLTPLLWDNAVCLVVTDGSQKGSEDLEGRWKNPSWCLRVRAATWRALTPPYRIIE